MSFLEIFERAIYKREFFENRHWLVILIKYEIWCMAELSVVNAILNTLLEYLHNVLFEISLEIEEVTRHGEFILEFVPNDHALSTLDILTVEQHHIFEHFVDFEIPFGLAKCYELGVAFDRGFGIFDIFLLFRKPEVRLVGIFFDQEVHPNSCGRV